MFCCSLPAGSCAVPGTFCVCVALRSACYGAVSVPFTAHVTDITVWNTLRCLLFLRHMMQLQFRAADT
jgi:hypothetical protein